MADKGFLISDLTTTKGVHLIIPPFKRKKKPLSKSEVQQTRDIANLRIHVEREMERIKNFRILQGIMPITMVGLILAFPGVGPWVASKFYSQRSAVRIWMRFPSIFSSIKMKLTLH